MTIAAVVDVGTNAIRLVWSEIDETGIQCRQGYERFALRLGTDVFDTGKLRKETVRELVEVFSEIGATMEDVGVDSYRAVATSAMRNASNGASVCRRIKKETGVRLDIISGEYESELSRSALERAVGGVTDTTLLIDLGGGSLEVERSDRQFARSVPFGTVRLLNQYPELRDPIGRKQLEHCRHEIYEALHGALSGCRSARWAVGTGGNFDAMARLLPMDSSVLPAIDVTQLRKAAETVSVLTFEERMKFYGLRSDRADLIMPAILVVEALVKHFRLAGIQVPGSGMREALLFEEHIAGCVRADFSELALRFGQKGSRFEQRLTIARGLFDALYPFHGLYPQALRVLELALALAESGALIGKESASSHTLYVAEHIEGVELTTEARALLGYVLASGGRGPLTRYGRRLRSAQRRAGDVLALLYQIALVLSERGVRRAPKVSLARAPLGVTIGRSWEAVAPLFEALGKHLGCSFEQAV